MPEDKTPSIEDLQSQLTEIQTSNELLKAELDELKKKNNQQETDLKKARELNMKFLERLPVKEDSNSNEDTEDSFENLVDEAIKHAMEKYK